MTSGASNTGVLSWRLRRRSGAVVLLSSLAFALGYRGAAQGSGAGAPSTPHAGHHPRPVAIPEGATFTALGKLARGAPLRVWDRSSDSSQAFSPMLWDGLPQQNLQWFLDPGGQQEFLVLRKAEQAKNESSSAPRPLTQSGRQPLRWVRFALKQDATVPQVVDAQMCQSMETSTKTPVSCASVPFESLARPFHAAVAPGAAALPLAFRTGESLCAKGRSRCSVSFLSWRFAQELTGYSDGDRDLPDLIWLEPHAKGAIALYDVRRSQHWATIHLPESVSQRMGRFVRATATDDRVIVADYESGSLLMDFAADTCRLLLPGEMLSCREGLGASVIRDWIEGRYVAPSKGKEKGFSARAANWTLSLAPLGERPLPESFESSPITQSAEIALYSMGHMVYGSTLEAGSARGHPFALQHGFVLHRGARGTDQGSLQWGGGAQALPANIEGQSAATHRTVLWENGQDPKVTTFSSPSGVPPETRLLSARNGIFFGTAEGLVYQSGPSPQKTSVEVKPGDWTLLSPEDAVVKRTAGGGGSCLLVHLLSHPSFPASFLESGLSLPCATTWRAAAGFYGTLLATWQAASHSWTIGWIR